MPANVTEITTNRVIGPVADIVRSSMPKRAPSTSILRTSTICVLSYLYGSLPLVYVLGRGRRVDLTQTGSGNVGATNLMAAGGPALAATGWIFDASKGLVPALITRQLGATRTEAELAAVCGVAGQCWPIFLRFRGGRGISAFVGAAFAMDRFAWTAAILPMIGGSLWRVIARRRAGVNGKTLPDRSRSVPFGCFLGTGAFPVVAAAQRRHPATAVAPTLLSTVIWARRLTAPQPDDATRGPRIHPYALVNRLLYDRNTRD